MIPEIRAHFNQAFTAQAYQNLLDSISEECHMKPLFRVAETPVFIDKEMKQKLEQACDDVVSAILRPDFKELSQSALLPGQIVPNETAHTTFLVVDFGICLEKDGSLSPKLIEVQGFPSLYFFQDMVAGHYRQHFPVPDHFTHLFGGRTSEEYLELMRQVIVGDSHPENVILLEIEPEKQVTGIDFYVAQQKIGIAPVCISKVSVEGRNLFYEKEGRKIQIEKIYNRVIFDELHKRDDLKRDFDFAQEYNVQYIGHPNWFFRISKHTLPLIDSPYAPKAYFLKDLAQLPDDLENYVLKPLFSFAGMGVIIDVTREIIEDIADKDNYILQEKVTYAEVIPTPNVPAKCEIRMLMVWPDGAEKPILVNNLARLSKGIMIGVRYNKDKDWVGGSVCYFEE
ncbi:MAG TPA: hypothetical protein PKA00_06410 [Saprospiraceae bacterium]|nr:hypothetical protein [Saprospiraceae bacterium]HMQ82518.1 hypothetical protein [Saprospiraceae bacterium]